MTLEEELRAITANFARSAPPQVAAALQGSIDELARSGIAARALRVGDLAPEFTLPDAEGQPVSLASFLVRGPVVLSFYRGGWCPYCNVELRAYQRILPEIRALGADFVAISPQTPESSLATVEKKALDFTVLSDVGNKVASEFGIAAPIPDVVKAITSAHGVDLDAVNGARDSQLPIPATYVVAPDRRIVLADIDVDFRIRLDPDVTLATLRELVRHRRRA